MLYYTFALYYIILRWVTLQRSLLYYLILHYITLYCSILYYIICRYSARWIATPLDTPPDGHPTMILRPTGILPLSPDIPSACYFARRLYRHQRQVSNPKDTPSIDYPSIIGWCPSSMALRPVGIPPFAAERPFFPALSPLPVLSQSHFYHTSVLPGFTKLPALPGLPFCHFYTSLLTLLRNI